MHIKRITVDIPYKKEELIDMIINARYGEEKVKNASDFFKFCLEQERNEFKSYNKTQLLIYLAINHNIKLF